jgi:hypothetical protein
MRRLYRLFVRTFLRPALPLALLFTIPHSAPGQFLGLGVTGGARLSDETFGNINTESKRYIFGPRMDVHLPRHFFVEVDALYRLFGFTAYQQSAVTNVLIRERANSWEFPVILKYRYTGYRTHPFLGAGYAPRFVHGNDVANGASLTGIRSGIPIYTYLINQQSKTSYPVSHGAVVSGGVEFVAGPVHISPELRYTHWTPPFLNFNESGILGGYKYNSDRNELLVLVGVTWH